MAERWILAVDHGNGGPKVAACSLQGEVLATALRPVRVQIGRASCRERVWIPV